MINDDNLNDIATKFSALAEPMRLRILHLLMRKEMNVGEIAQALNATQTNISRHLKKLSDAKIVSFKKNGTFIYYKICDTNLVKLCKIVCKEK